ncbi:LOW QUALITY PROTEIN: hypothetical protein CIRG_08724 [Coccidioides immitis RMSCC 2394]|uniref:Uncharacterized protein n=1 Tax=Coccidioides immitis RMSCC 2394 TaxID=404692 RepID=A0A0J6YQ26_COCIT|nr:LOW QUALITY PROTEIN: hypothetical protein CIRG_08724 [Coccidioides immitis RMSCC 2394]
MPPDRSCFTALNLPPDFTLPECMDYFTLSAAPNTDLWRKPPNRETTTAPILFTSLRQPFVIAEVTETADWEMEWDQGGLVIFAGPVPRPPPPPSPQPSQQQQQQQQQQRRQASGSSTQQQQQPPSQAPPPPYPSLPTGPNKWVKAGLEFSAGTVNASSVSATADGADWCLSPLAPPNVPTSITSLRIKLERIGHSLWVWYQIPGLISGAYAGGDREFVAEVEGGDVVLLGGGGQERACRGVCESAGESVDGEHDVGGAERGKIRERARRGWRAWGAGEWVGGGV